MIIYNVTSNVDIKVVNHWMEWMQTIHIPAMMSTGKFFNARMVRVLVEDTESETYSMQYYTSSKEMLQRYYNQDAPRLRQEVVRVFADKVLQFRTELEVIGEY